VPFLRRAGLTLKRLALALGVLCLIGGLSFLVAFPLWYFSTRSPVGFTIAVGALLAAGLVYLVVSRLRRASRRAGGFRTLAERRLLPALRTTGLVLACLGAVYGIALLIARMFR
jgi:ethanolamine transporter EutH